MKIHRVTCITLCSFALALGTAQGQLKASENRWIGTWAAAPVGQVIADQPTGDVTYREIVHVSVGGEEVRVILSNEFGTQPLTVDATHLAFSAGQSRIDLASDKTLTFSGKPQGTIPAGGVLVSDPVQLAVPPLSDLAISFFVPSQRIPVLSSHTLGLQENYAHAGNHTLAASLPEARVITTYPVLRGVEVLPREAKAAIACLGDSITDGRQSTLNANARWPNVLARRLAEALGPASPGVLDLGIGGNRLLETGTGPAALARLDRDVLSQSNLKYLIVLEGINDIGLGWKQGSLDAHPPTAEDIIAAYEQIIRRAHAHNVAVGGATLLPYQNSSYYSTEGESIRVQVNQWIRQPGHFDIAFDFEKVVRDHDDPRKLSPVYDSGDHLHPNDEGYAAIAKSIPLSTFALPTDLPWLTNN